MKAVKKIGFRETGTGNKWRGDLGWLGNKLGLSSARTERAERGRMVPSGGREYS